MTSHILLTSSEVISYGKIVRLTLSYRYGQPTSVLATTEKNNPACRPSAKKQVLVHER